MCSALMIFLSLYVCVRWAVVGLMCVCRWWMIFWDVGRIRSSSCLKSRGLLESCLATSSSPICVASHILFVNIDFILTSDAFKMFLLQDRVYCLADVMQLVVF